MDLRARLDRLLWLCLAALAVVAALGIAAGVVTGRQTGVLTGSILPRQEHMAALEDALQHTGGAVSRQICATDREQALNLAEAARQALAGCRTGVERLRALGVDIPDQGLVRVADGVARAGDGVVRRLTAHDQAAAAAAKAVTAAGAALAATRVLDDAMRTLGQNAQRELEAAQERNRTANASIKALISVQDRVSQLETLALQVRAAERRSRITAMRDRIGSQLEVMRNALAGAGLSDERLQAGLTAIEASFLGDHGLLVCRSATLAGGDEARAAEDAAASAVGTALNGFKPIIGEGIDQGELDVAKATTAVASSLRALAAAIQVRQAAAETEAGTNAAALATERLLSAPVADQAAAQAAAGAQAVVSAQKALGALATALAGLGRDSAATTPVGTAIAELARALTAAGDARTAELAAESQARQATTDLLASIDSLDRDLSQRADRLTAERSQAVDRTVLVNRLIPLSLLLVGCLAVWMARRAGRRIAAGVVAAEAETASHAEELDLLFAAIRPKAGQLNQASAELTRIASGLTNAAGDTATSASAAAAAAERVNSAIAAVAQGAQELDASLRSVSGHVTDVTGVCHEAVELAGQTGATVTRLGEAGTRIREVVRLIDRVAHQTNFLSLNASIEAAKAGEAGRGFAVVASEIEHLAHQIQASTAEVAGQVNGVQEQVAQAVEAIGRIQAIIARIDQLQAGVQQAVAAQSETTGRIGANAGTAAEDMTGIVATVNTVAEKAATTAQGAQGTNQAATSLVGIAGELDTLTRAR